MSAAQVTEAHRDLACTLTGRHYSISEAAELIAEREARAAEKAMGFARHFEFQMQKRIEDCDRLRAEVERLRALRALEMHDKEDQWTPEIEAAHPTETGNYVRHETAMKMVGNRHGKYELVDLVNWLLKCADDAKAERSNNKKVERATARAERAEAELASAQKGLRDLAGEISKQEKEIAALKTAEEQSLIEFPVRMKFRAYEQDAKLRDDLREQLQQAQGVIHATRQGSIDAMNRIRALVGATDADPLPAEHYVAEALTALRKERDMWKANHDNQVALKATIMQRADLGDRAPRVAALIAERNALRTELSNIANANPALWAEDADQAFPWAQSRARHTLAELERAPK